MPADPTYKKIEIVGTSTESFTRAVENGVKKAAQTVRGQSWFEIDELRGSIQDGKVAEFQVSLKIGFRLD